MQARPVILSSLLLTAVVAAGCARTDAERYTAGEDGIATFSNGLVETLYLEGCAPFAFERSLDGEWADAGVPFVCVWEGFAVPVERGEEVETPFAAPGDSGLYRLRYPFGTGCEPDLPLSQAGCETHRETVSNTFEVERELCEPSEPDCRFTPAAPNFLCEDGVHYGGPAAECTRDPASGRCGYEFLRCP